MEQSSSGSSTDDHRHGRQAAWAPIGGAVILAAILSWFWFLPGVSAQLTARAIAAETSTLDRVGSNDIVNALRTMNGSADFLTQFKARKDGCPMPLAWVSLVGAPKGQPEGLRITSGSYVSPEFDMSGDVPVRIAVPFPAPYEAGHGTIEVTSVGSGATVALSPALHVAPGTQRIVKQVVWEPDKRCSPTNE